MPNLLGFGFGRRNKFLFWRKDNVTSPSPADVPSFDALHHLPQTPHQLPHQVRIFVNIPLPEAFKDDSHNPHYKFAGNHISTTKYTVWNFVPKNIFEQFRRVANFFFLGIVVIQLLPAFQIGSAFFVISPLLVIVGATSIKDGFEDYKRHVSDENVNNSKVWVLGHWNNVQYYRPSSFLESLPWMKRERQHIDYPSSESTGSVEEDVGEEDLVDLPDFLEDSNVSPKSSNRNKTFPTNLSEGDIPKLLPEPGATSSSSPLKGSQSVKSHNNIPLYSHRQPTPSQWHRYLWCDLAVGDLVFICKDEDIPADIVILSSSEPNQICYVETKNLDGETNLKMRQGPPEFSHIQTPDDCTKIRFFIDSEKPNNNLYSYHGVIHVEDYGVVIDENEGEEEKINNTGDDDIEVVNKLLRKPTTSSSNGKAFSSTSRWRRTAIPVDYNGLLLRGCILRNTQFVIGVVVGTGSETKLMLNSGETPSKRTKIEKIMNPQILLNFLILFALCLVSTITNQIYFTVFNFTKAPFIPVDSTSTLEEIQSAITTFLQCLVMFQTIIPISLYTSIEFVKTIQAYFIHCDLDIYDVELDMPCSVKSWSLADDLGQIEYVFSDKTGTLTRNVMKFRQCSIKGKKYGHNFMRVFTPEGVELFGEEKEKYVEGKESEMEKLVMDHFSNPYFSHHISFVDTSIIEELKQKNDQSNNILFFFVHLAICHTVIPSISDSGHYKKVIYKAQSPDEEALVDTARDLGITFLSRNNNILELEVFGKLRTYEVLCVLEFTSARKRMSTIVRFPSGMIYLLCKGADNIIYNLLSRKVANPNKRTSVDETISLRELTLQHLEEMANEGLRTLCVAYRIVSEEEYQQWAVSYADACILTEGREEAIENVIAEMEKDLELLGATAIEDQLQEGVPETISTLLDAGIKVWVLTGDKVETAINIGFSCELLNKEMTLIVIQGQSLEQTTQQLTDSLLKFFSQSPYEPTNLDDSEEGSVEVSQHGKKEKHFALILDGVSLKYALEDKECCTLLLELGYRCKSVLCCRVSPKQKAKVVEMVRKGLKAMTLAVGDGANDVSMIQEADVGVGISGKEGAQAVLASDYAIAQFRFLKKLILVHGRWSYIRVSEMILSFFYKNIVFVFASFWHQFYCGFSAQSPFDFSYITMFNLIFTLLPIFALGIFDQDASPKYTFLYPCLYQLGLKRQLYTMERFWMYVADGFFQSIVCYFCGYLLYFDATPDPTGKSTGDQYEIGTLILFSIVITTNLYMCLHIHSWTWMTQSSLYISIISVFLFVAVYSTFQSSTIYAVSNHLFPDLAFWMTQYHPSNNNIVCERWKWDMDKVNERYARRLSSPAPRQEPSVWSRLEQYVAPLRGTYLVFMRSNMERKNTGFGFSHPDAQTQGSFMEATRVPKNFTPATPQPSWFSRKLTRVRLPPPMRRYTTMFQMERVHRESDVNAHPSDDSITKIRHRANSL